MKKEEWSEVRNRIKERILETFGKSPVGFEPVKNEYKVLEEYTNYDLKHIKISYHVFDDEWNEAVIVLPKGLSEGEKAPVVITIHGTNGLEGKYGVLDDANIANRHYAIELARRGFITASPDQYGFGDKMKDESFKKKFNDFSKTYPEWTLDSIRLLEQIRLIDVLVQLDYVDGENIGSIGNSLGGCASFHLSAFDERLKAAVVSTGISPNQSNVYRNLNNLSSSPRPKVFEYMLTHGGQIPWELNEMLALCAPRAILLLEPVNDPYNPDSMRTIECIHSAWDVYKLLGATKNMSLHLHGDGHDTVPTVRELAYDWLERFLMA